MSIRLFDKILQEGISKGQIPAREKEAREWYRERSQMVQRVRDQQLLTGNDRLVSRMIPGRMYMYLYDPIGKAELNYYDRFPIIFPIKLSRDGFIGLNMHYLPYVLRARLMDSLYDFLMDQNYDENTRLKLSYTRLLSSARYRFFKPTLKRYLNTQVRSRFVEIRPEEWDIALFLPTERFKKARKDTVWRESRRTIRERR